MGTERLTLLYDVRDPLEGHLQARSARRSLTGLFACPPSTETSRDRDRDGNPPWNIPPLPLHRQSVPQPNDGRTDRSEASLHGWGHYCELADNQGQAIAPVHLHSQV
jgi:hypothetical protein